EPAERHDRKGPGPPAAAGTRLRLCAARDPRKDSVRDGGRPAGTGLFGLRRCTRHTPAGRSPAHRARARRDLEGHPVVSPYRRQGRRAMSLPQWLANPLVQGWAETLLHFLWQGLLLALAGAALATRRPTPVQRHAVYLVTLLLMAACLPVTWG